MLVEEDFKKFDITEDQFGPVMLSRLGKGLYKNPLHCVREYVQNAVDGINKFSREYPGDQIDRVIRIQAEGDTITFHDNGIGMNYEDILTAISFGVSHRDVSFFPKNYFTILTQRRKGENTNDEASYGSWLLRRSSSQHQRQRLMAKTQRTNKS